MVSADMHVAANRPDIIFINHVNILIYYYYCVNFASKDFTRGGLCNYN